MSVELPLSHDELNVIRNRVRCSAEAQYTVWWELLVREVQRAAVNAALERAAQECDQAELTGLPSEWDAGYNTACRELGGRIRKLKTKEGA